MTNRPWRFFLLVLVLATPLWGVGALTERGLLAGQGTNLPFSALTFVCPIIAALVLVQRDQGPAGVRALLRRIIAPLRVRSAWWYAAVFLLLPLIYMLSFGIMRLMGTPVPSPRLSLPTILVLSAVFLLSGACEETGWTGYATDPLQARWGALGAALIVGVVWAAMHIVPDVQAHQSAAWIAGQRSFSVALRVLIVWLYVNTGRSVLAAVLFHATDNVSVYTIFPAGHDSHYEPAVTAVLTAITAVIVTVLWGAQTLQRFRFTRCRR